MNQWLTGDFSGVNPQDELHLLRELIVQSLDRGTSLEFFWQGLSERDPIAMAELALGSDAISDSRVVRGVLEHVRSLETVIGPSGLFERLVDLAPEMGERIVKRAISFHPDAPWLVHLSKKVEQVPGTLWLSELEESVGLKIAMERCANAGFNQALVVFGERTGRLESMVALLRAGRHEVAALAGARALSADVSLPIVPWSAAVLGPALVPFLEAIAAQLSGESVTRAFALRTQEFATVQALLGR